MHQSREADLRAERLVSGAEFSEQNGRVRSGVERTLLATGRNEKAVRQQDGLLFQGRIVPTEFRKDHQNFLAKSYWAAKGSVKEFLDNKCLLFQQLSNVINSRPQMTKNVIPRGSADCNQPFFSYL